MSNKLNIVELDMCYITFEKSYIIHTHIPPAIVKRERDTVGNDQDRQKN